MGDAEDDEVVGVCGDEAFGLGLGAFVEVDGAEGVGLGVGCGAVGVDEVRGEEDESGFPEVGLFDEGAEAFDVGASACCGVAGAVGGSGDCGGMEDDVGSDVAEEAFDLAGVGEVGAEVGDAVGDGSGSGGGPDVVAALEVAAEVPSPSSRGAGDEDAFAAVAVLAVPGDGPADVVRDVGVGSVAEEAAGGGYVEVEVLGGVEDAVAGEEGWLGGAEEFEDGLEEGGGGDGDGVGDVEFGERESRGAADEGDVVLPRDADAVGDEEGVV